MLEVYAGFRLVKAVFFPVIIYGYESWTLKKAEHQKIDAFDLNASPAW